MNVKLNLGTFLLFCTSSVLCAELSWWQKTIVYQIYPRSFQDSDGDGVGDIQGIISRLDYIKSLHVDTIWLSPIYTSPMADFGYDIADYYNIDELFGTLDDFDELVKEVHKRDMKIVMDYVPNHTSNKHKWFVESMKGGNDNPYKDFYCWHNGKILDDGTTIPPNNWLSIFGGSAWEWVEERQQYYLHQFLIEQPDLDYRNPTVVTEMQNVLKFWLDRGVDGFRVDAILTLFEVEDISLNEPRSSIKNVQQDEHDYLDHIHTLHLDEIHTIVRGWADVIEEYEQKTGKDIFTVMEVYDETLEKSMKYYESGSDMPFNFGFIFLNDTCGGTCTYDIINRWMSLMPEGKWPNFVLGNHDQRRITTRKGPEYVNAMNILLLTLPGTPTTYNGEEIGMLDIPVLSYEDTQDPNGLKLGPDRYAKYSRDPCRAPMQWDTSQNAGFSAYEVTWLPVHDNYQKLNVQAQENEPGSSLEIYKQAAALRQNPAFLNSNIVFHVVTENIVSFIRSNGDKEAFLVILNVGNETQKSDFSSPLGDKKVTSGEVVINTGNFRYGTIFEDGDIVELSNIELLPAEGLVLKITLLSDIYTEKKEEL